MPTVSGHGIIPMLHSAPLGMGHKLSIAYYVRLREEDAW